MTGRDEIKSVLKNSSSNGAAPEIGNVAGKYGGRGKTQALHPILSGLAEPG
jgi:hypothetical protein